MKHDWEYKKLGEVCDIINGKNQRNVESSDGEYPIMGSGGVMGYAKDYLCNAGTTIIGRKGTINRPIFVEEKFWNVDTAFGIQPKEGVSCKFIFYVCKSIDFTRYDKSVTIPSLVKSDLLKIPIPVPPLPIQEQIVAELDKVSEIIEKKKQQVKELDTLAQSIFYDMFGDPVENEKGWEVKKLEDIVHKGCPISYGIVQPGDDVECGVPVVRPIDMTDTFVKSTGLKKTTVEISNSYKRTVLKGNEILMCVRGTTGLVSLATQELVGANVTRGITPIECNDNNNRWFVYFQIKSKGIQDYIANYTKGIALKQINMKDVREIPLILPPLPLQQSFAQKVEAIEKQKELITASIKEAQLLFDARMDYWFGE